MNKLIDDSSKKTLTQLKELGRILCHPLRIQILNFIDKQGEYCVEDIELKLNIKQAIASQQLLLLRSLGFIANRRDKKRIIYRINNNINQIKIDVIIDTTKQLFDKIKPVKKC